MDVEIAARLFKALREKRFEVELTVFGTEEKGDEVEMLVLTRPLAGEELIVINGVASGFGMRVVLDGGLLVFADV